MKRSLFKVVFIPTNKIVKYGLNQKQAEEYLSRIPEKDPIAENQRSNYEIQEQTYFTMSEQEDV